MITRLFDTLLRRQPSDFTVQAAGFDYQRLVAIVLNGGTFATNPSYGITTRPLSRPSYRAYVYHLTGEENTGKNNVYLEVRGEDGNRSQDIKVGWTWQGKRPNERAPLVALDKPINEPAGNIGLHAGQIIEVWLTDSNGSEIGSDHVSGIHTGHDSDTPGNHRFHHSFFVLWVWEELGGPVEPPPDEPGGEPPADWLAWKAHIEAEQARQAAEIERIKSKLREAGQ